LCHIILCFRDVFNIQGRNKLVRAIARTGVSGFALIPAWTQEQLPRSHGGNIELDRKPPSANCLLDQPLFGCRRPLLRYFFHTDTLSHPCDLDPGNPCRDDDDTICAISIERTFILSLTSHFNNYMRKLME